ncbi:MULTISPECIES: hypothetical protein [Streptomyces]|uniref:hypothetical protein n=1 Tax=Streptomyces TaxID=1883 RepID=UPI002F928AD3
MSGAEWGDVASWAAFALAGGAFVVSLKARGDSQRSAAATVRAANAAEASVTEARKSANGAVRSATAAEEALALQRDDAAARRASEEEARRPRPRLELHHHHRTLFHLVNVGTGAADDLRLLTSLSNAPQELADGIRLEAGAVHEIRLHTAFGRSMPPFLEFVWQGQDEPIRLRIPPGA